MGKRVPYGCVDLKSVREDGMLYIDKTMYLEKLEQNNVLIYTRPRRFGKSMLTSIFLDILGNSGFVRAFYEVIKENLESLNPPIERFFATGVTPLTLDSLTSGFNIATKITNNPLFTAMCGLTEKEVKYAIKESGVPNPEEAFNKMKENYT